MRVATIADQLSGVTYCPGPLIFQALQLSPSVRCSPPCTLGEGPQQSDSNPVTQGVALAQQMATHRVPHSANPRHVQITKGLLEEFGEKRVIDTPITEVRPAPAPSPPRTTVGPWLRRVYPLVSAG